MDANISASGPIFLLHGTSSSGKSSTAKALQSLLGEGCRHFDFDTFDWSSFPAPEHWPAVFKRGQYQYLLAARAAALSGDPVILEYIFRSLDTQIECARLFEGMKVYFFSLYCPLPELNRRERERGDRRLGMAAEQHPDAYRHPYYDWELDTSLLENPQERARRILAHARSHPEPSAFHRLAAL